MALNNGASKSEILETLLQMAPYAGFPACWDALVIADEVFKQKEYGRAFYGLPDFSFLGSTLNVLPYGTTTFLRRRSSRWVKLPRRESEPESALAFWRAAFTNSRALLASRRRCS